MASQYGHVFRLKGALGAGALSERERQMILNSKILWGLSWTGLALVLAVPSADMLTNAFGGGGTSAVLTSDVDAVTPAQPGKAALPAPGKTSLPAPTKTATVTTKVTPNGVIITPASSSPPADAPIDTGKKLPDYISDGGPSGAPAAAAAETRVASIDPVPVAPMPFPAWARPAVTPAPVETVPAAPVVGTPAEPVVVVDETTLTGSVQTPGPVPPSPIVDDSGSWETESLRQYLERRGILDDGSSQSSATVTQRSTTTYDPNGFYLSDGPNSVEDRELRRQRILEMLEAEDPDSFTLF